MSESNASNTVEVFTDGACLGNPGPGGWAALLRFGVREKELAGGERDTTNNRMELMAAIVGIEALKRACDVIVTTDSEYVRRGVEEWMPKWKRNGWLTSDRKPVKNRDLWERLDAALVSHSVRWRWVKGHAGHVENERVDVLAREAAVRMRESVGAAMLGDDGAAAGS